ncbi:MAG TPA: hypothetical protein VMB49_02850 [Acidobacteriaceae bacterium]|nr:hypothetical protein [Acidobacteriaceae bacterium]
MPCLQMKELELSSARYAERRSQKLLAKSERRTASSAKRQIGQAHMAYVMQQHLKNCSECRRDLGGE